MKILAVIASPKGRGMTYKLVNSIEESLKKHDKDIEFEYAILKDMNFENCRGCFQCLSRGEQFCPLKDEREALERKMLVCDGLIFASPVYIYNVSWTAKNFIDRFAYVSHRPRFHGKKAMVVSTTGAVGLWATLLALAFPLKTWGFDIAARLGMEASAIENKAVIDKTAMKFYTSIKQNKKHKPGILNLLAFKMQKLAFGNAAKDSADYIYWKERGWLEPGAGYYCDARIGIVKGFISRVLSSILELNTAKQKKVLS